MTEDFDLVVIGGGPAGSTLASFVAIKGHRVLLLERERGSDAHAGVGFPAPVLLFGLPTNLDISPKRTTESYKPLKI